MRSIESSECSTFMSEVDRYLDGDLDDTSRAQLEAHLPACEQCSHYVQQLTAVGEMLRALEKSENQSDLAPQVLAVFQAWKAVAVAHSDVEESDDPTTILTELLDQQPGWRRVLIRNSSRYQGRELSVTALERAKSLTFEDPLQARESTEVAAEVSKIRLELLRDDEDRGSLQIEAAYAHAKLGNLRRLCSDFRGAEQAFGEAFRYLPDDEGAVGVEAQTLTLVGILLSTQSKFDEAIQHFDRAIELHRSVNDRFELGRDLLAKGITLSDAGDTETAIAVGRSALEILQEYDDRRLVLVGKHNLIRSLRAAGNNEEAMKLLPEVRALHAELGNAVDLTRLKWLEGGIAMEQGDLEAAEASFDEVKAFFVEKDLAHDIAMVSLDLATVYLLQGRLPELRTLSLEMLAIFEGLGTGRESRAALSFFEKAIEVEKAQMEMVADLLEFLNGVRVQGRAVARLSVPS